VLKGANGERIEDENLEVGGNPGIEEVETGRDLANTKTGEYFRSMAAVWDEDGPEENKSKASRGRK
jgi:hypothetical protein